MSQSGWRWWFSMLPASFWGEYRGHRIGKCYWNNPSNCGAICRNTFTSQKVTNILASIARINFNIKSQADSFLPVLYAWTCGFKQWTINTLQSLLRNWTWVNNNYNLHSVASLVLNKSGGILRQHVKERGKSMINAALWKRCSKDGLWKGSRLQTVRMK